MTQAIFNKLLAIFITVAIGWFAGRMRWLGQASTGLDPARVLGNAAFYIFVPALLFRTTARLDLHGMPWTTVGAFFVPVVGVLLGVYAFQRFTRPAAPMADREAGERDAARPAVRAITATFGNSVQIGIPLAAALFGEAGLGLHIALVSLHALVLLSVLTVLVELDLARFRAQHELGASLWRTLRTTAYNTVVHPVVLPVLAGLVWNLTGQGLPGPVDETLALLGTAVAPVCLVLIGISLAYYGVGEQIVAALGMALLKLVALPAVVLCVAHWGFGLRGLPLSVAVIMAALPAGSNALIFSQRYDSQQVLTTTTIVLSTFGFVLTVPLWLAVLAHLG
jgi:malonate transporter and related proteins